ncbi:DUF4292 domain-containing protein [Flavobacteriaceae bacterium AH-315-O20]|nr:DUF4292 domain-containing protein [Flavobacteriaceae bacterium AH-315-O20]
MLKKGIVFFVFIILLFSCKSTKVTDKNIKSLSAKNIIKKNTKATFDKKSVKASLIVKYIGKSNLPNLKASLRMEKDSIIWLSFSKLGLGMVKVCGLKRDPIPAIGTIIFIKYFLDFNLFNEQIYIKL